jgi:hypothetical protein
MNRPLKQPYQLIGTFLRYTQNPRGVTNGSGSAVIDSDWLRHMSIINLRANAAIPPAFLRPDTCSLESRVDEAEINEEIRSALAALNPAGQLAVAGD